MKEFHTYRDRQIVVTDETPLGFEEGTWIAYQMAGSWQIFFSQGEQTVYGIKLSLPLPQTPQEALERLQSEVDRDITELLAAEAGIRLRQPAPPVHRDVKPTDAVIPRWRGPDVTLPVSMLLDLHNSLSSTSPLRQEVIQFIQDMAAKNDKAHWARGVMKQDNGSLSFDEVAYDRAVHRGKQETYREAVSDALKKLQNSLLSVISNAHEESERAREKLGPGQPLVAPPKYSHELTHLKEQLQSLGAVTHHFSGDPLVLEAWELVQRLQLAGPDAQKEK